MDRGVMIFAFDNAHVDYLSLAAECAKRIHRHLNVPVCVVTDNTEKAESFKIFDVIRYVDPHQESNDRNYGDDKIAQFKNHSRFLAFSITPFIETIIIDSDYLVCSKQLSVLWGSNQEFLIGGTAIGVNGELLDQKVSKDGLQSTWATVIYFKRTPYARKVFRLVEYLAYSWDYFRHIYKIETRVYRNDYSFSIALHLLNSGLDLSSHFLPFSLITAVETDNLVAMKDDEMIVRTKFKEVTVKNIDLHVLHKASLLGCIKGRS